MEGEQALIVAAWRKRSGWHKCFPILIPRQKWKTPHHNLQVGDIGLVKYEKEAGPGRLEVGQDQQGHSWDKTEEPGQYKWSSALAT